MIWRAIEKPGRDRGMRFLAFGNRERMTRAATYNNYFYTADYREQEIMRLGSPANIEDIRN